MNKKQIERYMRVSNALSSRGLTQSEIFDLLRCSRRLSRWCEHEANGAIQRNGITNTPYWYNTNTGDRLDKARDTETATIKKIEKIISDCNVRTAAGLNYYYQGDCRGCALYILRPGDVPVGEDPSAYYNSGIAVCID